MARAGDGRYAAPPADWFQPSRAPVRLSLPLEGSLLLAALLLLPLDVALRRVFLPEGLFRRKPRAPAAAPEETTVSRLASLKPTARAEAEPELVVPSTPAPRPVEPEPEPEPEPEDDGLSALERLKAAKRRAR